MGAMRIRSVSCSSIFASTIPMRLQGGLAYPFTCLKSWKKASIASVSGSGLQLKKRGSLKVRRVANTSELQTRPPLGLKLGELSGGNYPSQIVDVSYCCLVVQQQQYSLVILTLQEGLHCQTKGLQSEFWQDAAQMVRDATDTMWKSDCL
uniref:Uncharacterized protein n=1 Tax=Amphimedon queenslandica TaxID=400682 RepID=A0A1X7V3G1_AMPQE